MLGAPRSHKKVFDLKDVHCKACAEVAVPHGEVSGAL